MMVESASAQTIPKPSVPEFTLKYIDSSYDVPATTSIDQYTGKTVTNQGYHVENRTIQLTIRNQPFTSYIQNGQNISFYYNVREKGQYAQTDNWITIFNPDVGFRIQSKSDYTTLYFSIDRNGFPFWGHLVDGGSVDFQVQALIGSVHRVYNASSTSQLAMFPWVFEGQSSAWSSTQTTTIPASSNSTPNPTQLDTANPTDSSSTDNSVASLLISLALVAVAVSAVAVVSLLLYVRHLKRTTAKPDNFAVKN